MNHRKSNFLLLVFLLSAGRAYALEPFPQPFNTEQAPNQALPAEAAAAGIQMPEGFHASNFASEPAVQQPISMTTDSRGRLWVVENYTYGEGLFLDADLDKLRDRILIFEDTDNDGRHDKRTIFWDGGQRITSIVLGRGGVWILALPELLFIPDANGDDLPDGEPEVILDGFNFEKGGHTVANLIDNNLLDIWERNLTDYNSGQVHS